MRLACWFARHAQTNFIRSFRAAPPIAADAVVRGDWRSGAKRSDKVRLRVTRKPARETHALPGHFILSKVFCSSSRSEALPVFSRELSIHFFSSAFLVGRSVS